MNLTWRIELDCLADPSFARNPHEATEAWAPLHETRTTARPAGRYRFAVSDTLSALKMATATQTSTLFIARATAATLQPAKE